MIYIKVVLIKKIINENIDFLNEDKEKKIDKHFILKKFLY